MTAGKGSAIWFGVLGVAALGIGFGSTGSPVESATPWGLLALLGIGLGLAGWGFVDRGEEPAQRLVSRRGLVTLLLLVGLGLVGSQDFLRAGIARSHDLPAHTWAAYATWRSALDGDLWPRWIPYLGFGMPLLQFYGPLPWLMTWPAQALGLSPVDAVKAGVVLSQIAAACSAWVACRWLGRSRPASLLAATALVLGPYHLLQTTYRLAYAEAWALALLPLVLAAAVKVAGGDRGFIGRLAALGVALLLTHPVSLVLLVPLSLVPVGLALRRRGVSGMLLAVGLAVGLSAAWWLPMTVEQPHTTLSQTAGFGTRLSNRAAWPQELVERQAWTKYDLRRRHKGREARSQAVPLYFGCGLLALLALAARRDPDSEDDPRWWLAAAAIGLLLAVRPTAGLLQGVPPFGRIQFAWRFLSPATACAALAAAAALDAWAPDPRRRAVLGAAAIALLAVDAVPYLGAAGRVPAYEGVVQSVGQTLHPLELPDGFVRAANLRLPPSDASMRVARTRVLFPEYATRPLRSRYLNRKPTRAESEDFGVTVRAGRQLEWLEPRGLVRLDGEDLDATWTLRPERIEIALPEGHAGGRLRFVSQWFPGWLVSVDGRRGSAALDGEGLLEVEVPARAQSVVFTYSSLWPWDRGLGWLITLLTLLALLVYAVKSSE